MTYASYVGDLTTLMITTTADTNFTTILPEIIAYAENRIYRELDLLATVVRDSSGSLTVGTRTFTLPQSLGYFDVIQGVNVITPLAAASADAGTRHPLTPISRFVIDAIWPSTTGATVPTVFAPLTDQIILVGPSPDAAYKVEVVGKITPTPLSVSNTTTYLTARLPDLFLAASMVFASGYQKNFGSQADDPKMAVSWETQYLKLFDSANAEDERRAFAASNWSSVPPSPIAQPPRT